MRTAFDTNILSALLSKEPTATLVIPPLDLARRTGALVVSAAVYAELLAHPRATETTIRQFLDSTGVAIDFSLSETVWTEAGRRYANYATRRRKADGVVPKRLLADFIIGSHALVQADQLMTLDPSRYRTDFPELILLTPGEKEKQE